MKEEPQTTGWNRTLFVTPPKVVNVAFKLVAVLLIAFASVGEWLVLRSLPDFALVSQHTSISGNAAFIVTQVAFLVSLATSILIFTDRKRLQAHYVGAWTCGIAPLSWLDNPSKFRRPDIEQYAEAYPFLFGFSIVTLTISIVFLTYTWHSRHKKCNSEAALHEQV